MDKDAEEELAKARKLCANMRVSVADLEAQLALIQKKFDREKTDLAEAEAILESLEMQDEGTTVG